MTIDLTTLATGLATIIAAFAAAVATWSKARQESNAIAIRDLVLSNETLMADLERDRERYQQEISDLRSMLDDSRAKYDLLYQEYLSVKEENVKLKARVLHLESKLTNP